MRVVFRVDASTVIGTGHLMRCLALADALRTKRHHVLFVSRAYSDGFWKRIRQNGFDMAAFPASRATHMSASHRTWLGGTLLDDANRMIRVLSKFEKKADWLVVDHYGIDRRWEKQMRPFVKNILVIDDLANRAHDCDVLLDQNRMPSQRSPYKRLVPSACRLITGPSYALLRSEFRQASRHVRSRDGNIRRLFLAFGGVDASNETEKALQVAYALNAFKTIDVFISRSHPHVKRIQSLCRVRANVRLHLDATALAPAMHQADVAIGAAGTMSWERCCIGLPSVAVVVVDNQYEIGKTLRAAQAGEVIQTMPSRRAEELRNVLSTLLKNPTRVKRLGRNAHRLVDGRGTERVMACLS